MEDWNVEEQLKSGQWTVHGLALAYCSIQPNAQGGEHRGSEIVPLFWLKYAVVWVLVSALEWLQIWLSLSFGEDASLTMMPHLAWWCFFESESFLWWCLFGDEASSVMMPIWWWGLFGDMMVDSLVKNKDTSLVMMPLWRWCIFCDDVSLAMSRVLFGDDAYLVMRPAGWWGLFGDEASLVMTNCKIASYIAWN